MIGEERGKGTGREGKIRGREGKGEGRGRLTMGLSLSKVNFLVTSLCMGCLSP